MSCIKLAGTSPIRSVRSVLFSVTSAVTLTTESRGSLVTFDWITTTGRRLAGRLPDGGPRSTQ